MDKVLGKRDNIDTLHIHMFNEKIESYRSKEVLESTLKILKTLQQKENKSICELFQDCVEDPKSTLASTKIKLDKSLSEDISRGKHYPSGHIGNFRLPENYLENLNWKIMTTRIRETLFTYKLHRIYIPLCFDNYFLLFCNFLWILPFSRFPQFLQFFTFCDIFSDFFLNFWISENYLVVYDLPESCNWVRRLRRRIPWLFATVHRYSEKIEFFIDFNKH